MNTALKRTAVLATSLSLLACATQAVSPPAAQTIEAGPVLEQANQAMGTSAVNTLRFAAIGTGTTYGQAYLPNTQWPKLNYSLFTRHMDYAGAAMREEFARSRAEPNGGGAVPLMGEGEQRAVAVVQGDLAWNMIGPAQAPSPVATTARIHDLWTSPHGVLKAAARNRATATSVTESGQSYRVLSFSESGRFSAQAYINAQGQVERVLSRMPHPVMGESAITTYYGGYKTQGGTVFPSTIKQEQDGHPVFDLQVSDVQINTPTGIAAGDIVKAFVEKATSEQAAPGVWYIEGGSHHSVAIEMRDHIIMIESPLYDQRAAAAIDEVKRVIPGKPIRFVVNSHHHFDHAGGLRAAAAEGATIVSSSAATGFFQKALATRSSIFPDYLSRSGRSINVEGVSGKRVFTDGNRSVEVHEIRDSVHAQGFLMVYLPGEKLLIQADAFTPGAPNSPPPAKPNGNHLNLISNIEKLDLKVERILPLHGRIVPVAELYRMVGK